ncbi:hypothetical protein TWF730_010389 [Orbilia blumenaviensis]|uniref:Uncharacterized protein n=1 Tax=Orbilia blumenaviensis TaxID=1796055 RepID=A0AAV9UP36_9PEZI
MSSNPFRRKPNDGTPSASGRTSLDIDQERLQQVAQQAFADGDDIFEQAGSSGPATILIPNIRPNPGAVQATTKAPESIPEPLENAVIDNPKKLSAEVTDKENKLENQVEGPAKQNTPPELSDATDKIASQLPSIPPTPPPSRPAAPPAPPRPRRSVKRPREEVTIRNPIVEEAVIVEVPTPVTPVASAAPSDDPFTEARLKAELEEAEKDDESSIVEIRKEDADIGSVKSIESEYEEDSASEISEVPTTSAASMSVKTVTSEPEYVTTASSPQTQPPNPFRKPTDPEPTLSRQNSLKNEKTDKLEALPPPIKFGNQQTGTQGSKANRQSLDVDAFKRLMLTGQAAHTPDSISTTESNNLSKQSLFENVEQSYTPRSSQDTGPSMHETEAIESSIPKAVHTPTPPPPKAKPPPPKPRGQRNSMPPPPRSESQPLPVKEIVTEAVTPQETPATPPKTPKPPAPLSRRVSMQVTSSPEGGFSVQSQSLPQAPPPPPPPPSRRTPSSPKQQPTTPPTSTQEPPPPFSLNTSPLQNRKPIPPPARRGSKRMSAPPGRLQATVPNTTTPSPSKTSSIPAPPPPPIRKKSQLSQSASESVSNPNEPPPRTSSSFDILEDLTKLQKEVDQLLGRV